MSFLCRYMGQCSLRTAVGIDARSNSRLMTRWAVSRFRRPWVWCFWTNKSIHIYLVAYRISGFIFRFEWFLFASFKIKRNHTVAYHLPQTTIQNLSCYCTGPCVLHWLWEFGGCQSISSCWTASGFTVPIIGQEVQVLGLPCVQWPWLSTFQAGKTAQ